MPESTPQPPARSGSRSGPSVTLPGPKVGTPPATAFPVPSQLLAGTPPGPVERTPVDPVPKQIVAAWLVTPLQLMPSISRKGHARVAEHHAIREQQPQQAGI